MISIWASHHKFGELMVDYDSVLLWLNAARLFFLNLVPVIAGFTFESGLEHGQALAYLALLTSIYMTMMLMKLYVATNRGQALTRDDVTNGDLEVSGSVVVLTGLAFTAGLILLWPDQVGSLIFVAFSGVAVRRVLRRRRVVESS